MTAALAGYTAIAASKQARAAAAQTAVQAGAQRPEVLTMLREAVRDALQPLTERLERLEQRLGPEEEPQP